jgi:hypothetical protein
VREIHPTAFLIGRLVVDGSTQDRFIDDPAGAGRAFAERILRTDGAQARFGDRLLFDAWESYNEAVSEGADAGRKRKYDDFQVAFARPIQAAGFEPIAMNFATATCWVPTS